MPKRRPADMDEIRSTLRVNCDAYAGDPEAARAAMDVMLTVRRTATALQTFAEEYGRPYGLSPSKLVIVMELAATRGGTLAMAALARRLGVALGNTTTLIRELERERVVRLRTDPTDARVRLVSLTPAGRRLLARFAPIHYATVTDAFGVLLRREQLAVVRALDRLREHIRAIRSSAESEVSVDASPQKQTGRRREALAASGAKRVRT